MFWSVNLIVLLGMAKLISPTQDRRTRICNCLTETRAEKSLAIVDQMFQRSIGIELQDVLLSKILHRFVRCLLRDVGLPPSVGNVHPLRFPQMQALFSCCRRSPTMNNQ